MYTLTKAYEKRHNILVEVGKQKRNNNSNFNSSSM